MKKTILDSNSDITLNIVSVDAAVDITVVGRSIDHFIQVMTKDLVEPMAFRAFAKCALTKELEWVASWYFEPGKGVVELPDVTLPAVFIGNN